MGQEEGRYSGKRERTPLKGKGASPKPIRPSNAAQQYGATDESGPLCCKAFVKGERIVALVDTGSALTLMSKALFDKIACKLENPKLKESNVNIMGVSGLRRRCEGRIENLPIKFKTKEWKLNAEIIDHPSVDVILGQNFLMEVDAEISMPKLQMILGQGQEQVKLYRERSKNVSLCLMGRFDTEKWQSREKRHIPKSQWKCKQGPAKETCITVRGYTVDPYTDPVIPCSLCADEYWERKSFEEKQQELKADKYGAHSDGWIAVSEGSKTDGDLKDHEYKLWVKGSELKMNGEVVANGIAMGHIGKSWTKYHPKSEPPKPRQRDPAYEWRTKIWRSMYVTEASTDLQKWQQEDALEQWHKKHDPEPIEDQMDVDLPEIIEEVKARYTSPQGRKPFSTPINSNELSFFD